MGWENPSLPLQQPLPLPENNPFLLNYFNTNCKRSQVINQLPEILQQNFSLLDTCTHPASSWITNSIQNIDLSLSYWIKGCSLGMICVKNNHLQLDEMQTFLLVLIIMIWFRLENHQNLYCLLLRHPYGALHLPSLFRIENWKTKDSQSLLIINQHGLFSKHKKFLHKLVTIAILSISLLKHTTKNITLNHQAQ